MDTETSEPQTHLEMEPVKNGTDHLCESIVNQDGFKELYSKIDSFITDEKLKYEYSTLNDRGALLQQKQQTGVEITEEEIAEFEKLREEFMANPIATNFLDAQEEVQQVQVTQEHFLVVEAVVVIYPVLNPTIQQLIL